MNLPRVSNIEGGVGRIKVDRVDRVDRVHRVDKVHRGIGWWGGYKGDRADIGWIGGI